MDMHPYSILVLHELKKSELEAYSQRLRLLREAQSIASQSHYKRIMQIFVRRFSKQKPSVDLHAHVLNLTLSENCEV